MDLREYNSMRELRINFERSDSVTFVGDRQRRGGAGDGG